VLTRPIELDACGIGFVADAHGRASRQIVEATLTGLACVKHRGAIAADGLTGDGAGILVPIPQGFFARVAADAGLALDGDGVGVITGYFDAASDAAREIAMGAVAEACTVEGIPLAGWREVPVDEEHLGDRARAIMPAQFHGLLARPRDLSDLEAERRCYRARRRAEAACDEAGVRAYFASWSFATVVYKGLVISDRMAAFFPDLAADDFIAPLAVFHQRFSTNTTPTWERAQPFRFLCHNGEINTLQGNEHRMSARSHLGTEEAGLGSEDLFRTILSSETSDSGKLDEAVELLVRGGRDLRHSLAMLIPEAWEGQRDLPPEARDFFRYHACLQEPWDGPAGVVFTDGRRVGATLDRNGLRPLRWQICEDGMVVCASEVGAVPVDGHGVVQRGRLGPGEMIFVDPDADGASASNVQHDEEIKIALGRQSPYGVWNREGLYQFDIGDPVEEYPDEDDELPRLQAAFGLNKEEVAMILKPIALAAKEPTFSMGDDVPFAGVGSKPRPVHHYLKQRFAQVTNPPIDHLRERIVMSLRTLLGPRQPLLSHNGMAARLAELDTFFLYPEAVERLLDPARGPFAAARIDCTFAADAGRGGLRQAIDRIADEAERVVGERSEVLVLSDAGVGPDRVPVPSILAAGAVHHRLTRARLRDQASIVVDTGEARDTHAMASLLGYGADAICPRLALQSVAQMADADQLDGISAPEAQMRFRAGIEDGVLKIFSKMGISTVDGYRGAQIFEALNLSADVVDVCLTGTASQVGGVGFESLAAEALAWHAEAFGTLTPVALDAPGIFRDRKGGEYHAHNDDVVDAIQETVGVVPERKRKKMERAGVTVATLEPAPVEEQGRVIFLAGDPTPADPTDTAAAHLLQRAVRDGRDDLYRRFSELVEGRPTTELHDLLELVPAGAPIPLDDVEPASEIAKRFSTGAMSHGALSKEAHETLAMAMNLIGGKSNCGEGGEAPERYRTRGTSVDKNSRIKQIASGRFGVTPEYCAFADELNIKMAQGSKPGEGGQLPGHKVSDEIARLRHTQQGVGLISPPPHHDIYSIEDLAQLIYDLKQVNPSAEVSVKLVAEAGVGTIACGVSKALADTVQISGNNGGTGASPLSSIKHAGMPWELGLADTQQALVENGLRDRIKVRVDGGMLTGYDVVIGALLGADEYSFGTAAMIAEGCIMVRACHKDTCPTGVATQRPNLRAKFTGTPEGVAQYLLFVAEEARRHLAALGFRTIDEAIGRVECLRQRSTGDAHADALDLSPLLTAPADPDAPRRFLKSPDILRPRSALDEQLLFEGFNALWEGEEITLEYAITNADRTIGASIGGAIGLEWGCVNPPPGRVVARFTGSAGQSFGAFLNNGVTLELTGEANDYVGKGMGGGRIVVRPPVDDAGDPVLAGNTVLYGATGGELFIAGEVGERFMVRNSGAVSVVEGAGDHCCEYMTGGTAVVLGSVGYNLGAGMTGGEAFVYDPEGLLTVRMNSQLVEARKPDEGQVGELRSLIETHVELTGSPRATALLANWDDEVRHFMRVAPVSEVARIERANEGDTGDQR